MREKKYLEERKYILDAGGIDEIAMDIQKYMTAMGQERREAIRVRLTIEEMLIRVMGASGDHPASAELSVRKRFGQRDLLVFYDGPAFDPTTQDEEGWGSHILNNLGLNPIWSWKKGKNLIQIRINEQKKRSQLFFVFLAAVGAILLGPAAKVLSAETVTFLNDVLLTPVFEAFLGLLNTFAGLMILTTIASGIYGIGDTGSLSRVGKVMFPRFLVTVFAASAAAVLLTRPFLSLMSRGRADGVSQAREISRMLFDILPKNPVSSFLDANAMQIVVIAIFTGVVLLMLGEQTRHFARFLEESSLIVQTMLRIVCNLIPLFVFVSLLRLIWSGAAATLVRLWKPLLLTVGVNLVLTAVLLIMASIRGGASPVTIFKKIFPPVVIAFSTRSNIAAYPSAIEIGEYKLGIRRRLLDIGFPIGIVIYMPCVAIYFAVLCLFLAEQYQVEVTLSWLIMAVMISAILAIAAPPVPGAMMTCYGILLTQMGIPGEGVLLATALDIIMDFILAGCIIMHLQMEMVLQAARLDMLDRETLQKPAVTKKHV